jgi:diaminopimelate epimerase
MLYFCEVKGRFYKYQGTGNDFVVVDGREWTHEWQTQEVVDVCSRKWGVGSDGLIIVKPSELYDFEMIFFNPDGSQSFCGNGSRAAVRFYCDHFENKKELSFAAIDGNHLASIVDSEIEIKMINPHAGKLWKNGCFIHTGSPHVVQNVASLQDFPILEMGREIRYHEDFTAGNGTNVNFIQVNNGQVEARTYERGVEDETLSCGTGVTAVGLYILESEKRSGGVQIKTPGGSLHVRARRMGEFEFEDVYLKGAAEFVFEGIWEIKS